MNYRDYYRHLYFAFIGSNRQIDRKAEAKNKIQIIQINITNVLIKDTIAKTRNAAVAAGGVIYNLLVLS